MSSQEPNSNQAFKQTRATGTKKKKPQPPSDINKPKRTE
ncbi:hypothetical protein COO91_06675 [Nostoc flagelliforme CCNUN1]|uniref:Uncharacterized protein n=1 Tax=Nostoc flagelliforme CCNUN1 TaxID=2038116 RepID=A0A2K8SYZ1_9NOSO|nr:hypothetical protein COO91_06675 [Nostoc flagelliforme CCNUN1]